MTVEITKYAGIPIAFLALSSGGLHQEAIAAAYEKNIAQNPVLEETNNPENSYFLQIFADGSGGYYQETPADVSKRGHPLLRKLKAMSDVLPNSAFDNVPHNYSTSYKKEPRA